MLTTIPADTAPTLPSLPIAPALGPLARAALELGLPVEDVRAYVTRPADRLEPLALAAREVWVQDRLDAALERSAAALRSGRPADRLPASVLFWRGGAL